MLCRATQDEWVMVKILTNVVHWGGFLDSSVGKESTCSAGDPCSVIQEDSLENTHSCILGLPLWFSYSLEK